MIRTKLPDGGLVVEKPMYLRRVWAFEVSRLVDDRHLRHEVHLHLDPRAGKRWTAFVEEVGQPMARKCSRQRRSA